MSLNTTIAKQWPIFLAQGVLAILLALVSWLFPQLTLSILIIIFATYFFLDGATRVWLALKQRHTSNYWTMTFIGGVLGIIGAIVIVSLPELTAYILLYLIAFWAIIIGLSEIYAAVRLSKHLEGYLLVLLAGILSVVFGIYLIVSPSSGLIAVLWMVAIYAFIFGVMLIWLSLKLKRINERFAPIEGES